MRTDTQPLVPTEAVHALPVDTAAARLQASLAGRQLNETTVQYLVTWTAVTLYQRRAANK